MHARPDDRPFTLINMACTLDGKTSTIAGTGARFSSPSDKARLDELRASADAILMGAHTIAVDRPRMGVLDPGRRAARQAAGKPACPLRVVVSGAGSLSPRARLFDVDWSPVLVFTTETSPPEWREQVAAAAGRTGGAVHVLGQETVDLRAMMRILAARHAVARVVGEGGATLNFHLLAADLVDEIWLTICPLVFGGATAATVIDGAGFPPDRTRHAELLESSAAHGELFLRYRILPGPRRYDQRWTVAPPAAP